MCLKRKVKFGNIKLHGIEGRFLDLISKTLKFKWIIKTPPDRESGRMNENGSWTGLIGMIQRKEVDMALNLIPMTESRTNVVDFSDPYTIYDVTFIVEKPGTVSPKWVLLYPFDNVVWFCTLMIFLVGLNIFAFILKRKVSYCALFFSSCLGVI
ncbi:glutamate receptor ionotropic, delta-1 [Caerostris extrusa]|uniref:Glutamate receptor ionotropic, delta-1 n=1 Tax=Caerostris extrusa TaxID=172846 RepID=A0AAV4RZ72_CAEEX|nr:glutamate receptor ionotropic, delta-1 [Caerostris extrusa]